MDWRSTPGAPSASENITADGNKTSDGVYIDNDPGSPKDVTLSGILSFKNNGNGDGDDGLYISSKGNVTLADVVATGNKDEGVEIINTASSASATVTIGLGGANIFSSNSRGGLLIRSDGNVSLSNVTADNSGGDGANIENHTSNTQGFVSITGTNSFSGNVSDGIYVRSDGYILLENVTANNNINDSGARLDNDEGGANASSYVSSSVPTASAVTTMLVCRSTPGEK